MNRREKEARKKRRRDDRARARPPVAKERSPEDRVMVALGFDIEGFIREGVEDAVSAVRTDRSSAGIAEAVARVEGSAARALVRHLAVLPPSQPIACADGCAHCCSLRAEVSLPEVLRIADHLTATLPAPRLDEVRARVLATAREVVGLGADARAEAAVPCALLDGDRCSVYEVRPLVCRGCNAADPEACEASLSDGEVLNVVYAPQSALHHYGQTAIVRAARALGMSDGLLELNSALAVALATPDVTGRVLRGDPVFKDLETHPLLHP